MAREATSTHPTPGVTTTGGDEELGGPPAGVIRPPRAVGGEAGRPVRVHRGRCVFRSTGPGGLTWLLRAGPCALGPPRVSRGGGGGGSDRPVGLRTPRAAPATPTTAGPPPGGGGVAATSTRSGP